MGWDLHESAAGMSIAPKITALRGGNVTLAAAADAFLATPRTADPNTHRAHASAIDRGSRWPACSSPPLGEGGADLGVALGVEGVQVVAGGGHPRAQPVPRAVRL
ncbi:hypothetical protein GCM10010149_92970 [Nonomuraea roseoviolacea subsp. roseoviolacea]